MALPATDAVVELAATFLVAAAFYAVALHLAATFVLGDVSIERALLVGPVPALVVVLGAWSDFVEPAALLAVLADFAAIRWSYEVENRLALAVTVGHVVVCVLLAASLYGLVTSLFG